MSAGGSKAVVGLSKNICPKGEVTVTSGKKLKRGGKRAYLCWWRPFGIARGGQKVISFVGGRIGKLTLKGLRTTHPKTRFIGGGHENWYNGFFDPPAGGRGKNALRQKIGKKGKKEKGRSQVSTNLRVKVTNTAVETA